MRRRALFTIRRCTRSVRVALHDHALPTLFTARQLSRIMVAPRHTLQAYTTTDAALPSITAGKSSRTHRSATCPRVF